MSFSTGSRIIPLQNLHRSSNGKEMAAWRLSGKTATIYFSCRRFSTIQTFTSIGAVDYRN
jgi:hypothetical protein